MNNKWIKADHFFEQRLATFYVTRKQILMNRPVFDNLRCEAEPDALEAVIVGLVEKQRPELKGCNVFAIEYDLRTDRWRFAVSHGSLAKCPFGCIPPERPLDPACEKDMAATAQLTASA